MTADYRRRLASSLGLIRSQPVALHNVDVRFVPLETNEPDNDPANVLTLTVMARLQRVGREMRMLVENSEDQTTANPGLLRIIARAHDIQARLTQNTDLTVHAIASQERVSAAY